MDIEDDVGEGDGTKWFSPDVGDNLDKPESEQSRLRYKRVTGRDKLKTDARQLMKTRAKRRQKDLHAVVNKRNQAQMLATLEDAVVEIRNFNRKHKNDKGEIIRTPITSIADLIKFVLAAPNPAYLEVLTQTYDEIMGISSLDGDLEGE